MFGVFCAAMGLWALLCIKETKGRSLEDMDALFGGHIQQAAAKDVETAGADQDGDKDARARHEEQVVR